MRRRISKILACWLLAAALSACGANHHSIFRDQALVAPSEAILVDAKQRAVLTSLYYKYKREQDGSWTESESVRRFCSEPSPDVFSVIAQSMSLAGSFGQESADPAAIQAALNAAFSSAETGSTIPRTQTINMLRELMFRTCERYLSGGIDELELSVQAVRDQRLMVSILAIEQLTGAVAPNPVVLRASGSGGAGLGGEAVETFAKLRDEKKKADGEAATALAAYNEKFGEDKECTKLRAVEKPSAEQEKLLAECKTIEDKKTSTASAAKEAGEAYDVVRTAMETGGVSVATVTDAIAAGGLSRAGAGSVKEVASAVERIVALNFSDDSEVLLFCIRAMRDGESLPSDPVLRKVITDTCVEYMGERIGQAAAERALIKAQQEAQIAIILGDFGQFWAKVAGSDGNLDMNKFNGIRSSLDPAPVGRDKQILDAWKAGQSKAETQTDFVRLTGRVQSALAN